MQPREYRNNEKQGQQQAILWVRWNRFGGICFQKKNGL